MPIPAKTAGCGAELASQHTAPRHSHAADDQPAPTVYHRARSTARAAAKSLAVRVAADAWARGWDRLAHGLGAIARRWADA